MVIPLVNGWYSKVPSNDSLRSFWIPRSWSRASEPFPQGDSGDIERQPQDDDIAPEGTNCLGYRCYRGIAI